MGTKTRIRQMITLAAAAAALVMATLASPAPALAGSCQGAGGSSGAGCHP